MSGKTTTKSKVTPWDPASINAASGALKTGYGQATANIAQLSPILNNAITQASANVNTPPQYLTDARAQLDKTINGDYLDPASNPYASGMAKLIADRTQGNYNQTFGASGRAHGGLAALLSGQGVGDALGSFYGGLYQNERGAQQQATMAAPAFHQDQYTDINNLLPAVQGTSMLPLNAAATYAAGTGGLLSPYTNTTQTQKQGFGLGQILGLAGMVGGAFMPGGGLAGLMGGGGGAGIPASGGGLMGMGGGNGSGFIGLGGSFLG